MHPQLQLIYPSHMIVIWLEYILLAFVIILFIDLVIALILLTRSRTALAQLQSTVEAQHGTILTIGGDIVLIRNLCEKITSVPKQEDTLPEFVAGLTNEQKTLVQTEYLGNGNKIVDLPFGLHVNHSGYADTEITSSQEIVNDRASLDAGIPIFDIVPVASVPKRKDRKSTIKK